MLSGIMAIFEMGLAVTGQSFLGAPIDSYSDSSKDTDKKFIKGLYSGWDDEFDAAESPLDPCNKLKKIKDFNEYDWKDGSLKNSCVTHNGNHRIIVQLNLDSDYEVMKYRVYSCIVDNGQQCFFEKEL